jgi:uncharacterized protein involved in exopolysaccharide biosynthesis
MLHLPAGPIPRGEDEDSFDLRGSIQRVFDACRTYRWPVAATVFATLAIIQVYVVLWPPIYETDVLVVGDSPKDVIRSNFYEAWNVFRREDLPVEAELMTSRTVLVRVVTELGLTYDDVYHPFLSHAAYLWQESWVGKRYRAVKRLIFPKPKGPYDPTPEQIELARTVRDFQDGVRLDAAGEAPVGHLKVRGPSPRVAEIANKLIDVYLEERTKHFFDEAKRAYDSLSSEVETAGAELLASDLARRKFYEENGLVLDFEKDKHEVAQTAELDARVRDAQAEIDGLRRKQQAMKATLEGEPLEVVGVHVSELNTLRERMIGARFDLENQLAATAQRYRPDSPEVLDLKARIKQLDDEIAGQPEKIESSTTRTLNSVREQVRQREIESGAELERLQVALESRQKILGGYNQHVALLPAKLMRALELGRELRLREQRYNVLSERQAMARVSMATVATAASSMRVADHAAPPAEPIWPRTRLFYLGGLAVGLLAGIGLAVLLDILQGRVTDTRLRQTHLGLPVYGTLQLASRPLPLLLLAARNDDAANALATGGRGTEDA